MPLISVLMGVYNPQSLALLRRSVYSVLRQSFGDFELIICDDGSNEEVWKVLKSLKNIDKRIILLRNFKNLGLAKTLNRCADIAKGEYFFRQDDDDISHPKRFEAQVHFLQNHPEAAMVGCNIFLYDRLGIWGKMRYPKYPRKKDFLFTVPFMHGTIAIRSAVFRGIGGYTEDVKALRVEDTEMFMRLYSAGYLGYNLQQNLYAYREDYIAQKKRKYRYRLNEVWVRWHGFSTLGLLPKGLPYVLKPLVVGLMPLSLLNSLKDWRYSRKCVKRGGNRNG